MLSTATGFEISGCLSMVCNGSSSLSYNYSRFHKASGECQICAASEGESAAAAAHLQQGYIADAVDGTLLSDSQLNQYPSMGSGYFAACFRYLSRCLKEPSSFPRHSFLYNRFGVFSLQRRRREGVI